MNSEARQAVNLSGLLKISRLIVRRMKCSGSKIEIQQNSSGSAEVQLEGTGHSGGIAEKSAVSPFAVSMPCSKKLALNGSDLGNCQIGEPLPDAKGKVLLDGVRTTEQADSLKARTERKRRSVSLASRIELFDKRLAERMRRCGSTYAEGVSKCKHRHHSKGVTWLCDSRICSNCEWVRSGRLVRRLSGPLTELQTVNGLYASFLTLTFLNFETLPKAADLVKARRRLLRSKFWRSYGLWGSIGALEVKIGSGSGKWHPHFHLVVFTEKPIPLIEHGEQAGNWQLEVNQACADAWATANDDNGTCIVRGKAFDGNFGEILKYIGKGTDEMSNRQLQEFSNWSKGKRFLFTTGKLYANKDLKALIAAAEVTDEQEHTHGLEACPECGCRELEVSEMDWRFDLDNFVVRRVFDLTLPEQGEQ
jgi:hypothetical protein